MRANILKVYSSVYYTFYLCLHRIYLFVKWLIGYGFQKGKEINTPHNKKKQVQICNGFLLMLKKEYTERYCKLAFLIAPKAKHALIMIKLS